MIHTSPVYASVTCFCPSWPGPRTGLDSDVVPRQSAVTMMVLQADVQQFGLLVDDVLDTEENRGEALGKLLSGLSVYAGSAILGEPAWCSSGRPGVGSTAHVLSELQKSERMRDTPAVNDPDLDEFSS